MSWKTSIPIEYLRQTLDYDPETGVLTWKERPAEMFAGPYGKRNCKSWNTRFAGKAAGSVGHFGYYEINVLRCHLRSHRVIIAMVNGAWPDGEVDHINGDRTDNRLGNLRTVSTLGNALNKGMYPQNTSGFMGVAPRRSRWQATIGVPGTGRTVHLGCFATIEEAVAARQGAERAFGYHRNHGKRDAFKRKADLP